MLIAILTAACLWQGPGVFAAADEPDAIPVAEYERFLDSINEEIEHKIQAEFAAEEQEIEELSHPFKRGDKVTVRYWRGGKLETHTGTLVEVRENSRPPMVRVGDRDLPWGDIYRIDQERLSWSTKASLGPLKVRLEQRLKVLEERKQRLRDIERRKLLSGTVYGGDFEKNYVALENYYRRRSDLGDQTYELTVTIDETGTLAFCSLTNRSGKPGLVTVYLDQTPIATNVPAEVGVEVPSLEWKTFSWWVFRQNLRGENALTQATGLGNRLLVHVLRREVGAWFLVSDKTPAAAPRRARSNRVICPECFGTGQIIGTPGAAPIPAPVPAPAPAPAPAGGEAGVVLPDVTGGENPANNLESALDDVVGELASLQVSAGNRPLITCPSCLGQRQIDDDKEHPQVRAIYKLSLVEGQIKGYTAVGANEYFAAARRVDVYQGKVTAEIDSIKQAAQKARLANQAEVLAKQRAAAERAKDQLAAMTEAGNIQAGYTWLTVDELREQTADGDLIGNYRSLYRFDEVNFPATVTSGTGEVFKIDRYTVWEAPKQPFQIRSDKPRFLLFGLRYRVLRARTENADNLQFFLQYAVDVDTTNLFEPLDLRLVATLKLKDGTALEGKDATSMLPTRVSTYVGMVPVSPRNVGTGVADLELTATPGR